MGIKMLAVFKHQHSKIEKTAAIIYRRQRFDENKNKEKQNLDKDEGDGDGDRYVPFSPTALLLLL